MDKKQRWYVILAACGVIVLWLVWLRYTPPGLLGKADAIGYAVCHQIDGRSFHFGERAISLCARCTGQYLGAAVGLVYMFWISRRRGRFARTKYMVILGVLAVIWGVDGLNSFLALVGDGLNVYEPNNVFRILTGTGLGLGIAGMLVPAFNQTMWADLEDRPAIDTWGEFGLMAGIAYGIALLTLTENPLILYPLTLAATGAVVVVLSMVYAMVWVMLFRREASFRHVRELVLPLLGGFAVALAQIGVFDLARYWLTGTWEGFHIFF